MRRAALLCAALALLGAIYALKASRKMPDFEVYWRAGLRAVHGEPLYSESDGHYQFKYLPAFAVLVVPLAWLPLPVAKAAWFAVSAALVGAFIAMSIALLPSRRRPYWMLLIIVVLAMAKFYGHELILGQVNFLLGALITAAILLLRDRRQVPAGLLLAVAIVVKPYAVIFVPWLAATGCGRALMAAAAGLVAALLLPAPIYGFGGTLRLHTDWWRTVSTTTAPNLLNADNVSLAAMYAKWAGVTPTARWLALLTSAAVIAIAADAVRRRGTVRAPMGLETAILLTMIPLLSPQGWDYVFLLATPAVVFLVNYGDGLPRALGISAAAAVAVAAFSLFDVMGRRAYGAFMALSIISICFLVVIGALYVLRVRRVA